MLKHNDDKNNKRKRKKRNYIAMFIITTIYIVYARIFVNTNMYVL